MNAIIIAGGLGQRLLDVSGSFPKALVPIDGTPFVDIQIDLLKNLGIEKIVFALGYKSDQLISYLDHKYVDIYYAVEKNPFGTGGAILNAVNSFPELFSEQFFVMNGDTLIDFSLTGLAELHNKMKNDISLLLIEVENADRFGSVIVNKNIVVGYEEKACLGKGLINGGAYILSPLVFQKKVMTPPFSFEREVLADLSRFKIGGMKVKDSSFIDIGTPESYNELDIRVRTSGFWKKQYQ